MSALVTFVSGDQDPVDFTPASDVAGGDVVVQGDLVGIATRKISANKLGALATAGIWDFPKATTSGSAITAGTILYWDAGNQVATSSASGNKRSGKAIADAAAAASTVRVLMDQG